MELNEYCFDWNLFEIYDSGHLRNIKLSWEMWSQHGVLTENTTSDEAD